MALDGKVSANNDALGRHPDLVTLGAKKQDTKLPGERRSQTDRRSANSNLLHSSLELAPTSLSQISNSEPLNLVELDGNIGILCNGVGLTMATLDAVAQEGGKPANFVNLGSLDRYDSVEALHDRAELALELVSQDKSVKVVLVNILASTTTSEAIISAVVGYLERKTRANRQLQIVLLLVGIDRDAVKKRLGQLHVQLATSLDQAVAQTVSLAKQH